jgi:hypothetical protein
MAIIFWICTVLGVSVLVCQFIMSLMGLSDIDDLDVPHDIGHPGDAGGHDHAGDHHHGSNWFFGIITFRTAVAALAFFGLAGLAAQSASVQPEWLPLPIALFVGWCAMYAVHWMMQSLHRLKSEGTARIEYSVGQPGSVYLRIPASRGGAGKVTLTLQNRTMEFQAMTSGDAIPTGARIVVTDVLGPDMVEVAMAPEPEVSHV